MKKLQISPHFHFHIWTESKICKSPHVSTFTSKINETLKISPHFHFHIWKESKICKSPHVATFTFTFERNQRFANLPSWPLGQQGINHRKSDATRLLGSLPTILWWWGVQQWRRWPQQRSCWWELSTPFPFWHSLGLAWLRHLSCIVVSCIKLTFAGSNWLYKSSQPPLKIISHKILVLAGMDGQPYLRRLLLGASSYTYAGLTPYSTYYAVVLASPRWTPVTLDVCWMLYT